MFNFSLSYLEVSRLLIALSSPLVTYGLYHQVWKIFKTKSAKDFSLSLISALMLSEAIWLNYGLVIEEWPIILVSCINFPAVILAVIGYYLYGATTR
ncbi:MAG: hypothetical protein EPN21_01770 [Methylococcaceae bacterium]|nr:MAG: hypothetical protein EPN21_01770 [Methylococcaceae bacterium]